MLMNYLMLWFIKWICWYRERLNFLSPTLINAAKHWWCVQKLMNYYLLVVYFVADIKLNYILSARVVCVPRPLRALIWFIGCPQNISRRKAVRRVCNDPETQVLICVYLPWLFSIEFLQPTGHFWIIDSSLEIIPTKLSSLSWRCANQRSIWCCSMHAYGYESKKKHLIVTELFSREFMSCECRAEHWRLVSRRAGRSAQEKAGQHKRRPVSTREGRSAQEKAGQQ